MMKPTISIKYCPKCGWLLRTAYMAKEIHTTFAEDVEAVSLKPAALAGTFTIDINEEILFDRKERGRFPEIKELKQLIRDKINPEKGLGHSDKKG
jgi:selenoprotein W-related protein